MKKILYDFLLMRSHDGATQYNRSVFHALLERVTSFSLDVQLYCLYDSTSQIVFPELSIENLSRNKCLQFVDINKGMDYVNSLNCDVFFFGCAQFGYWYPQLSEIKCKSVIVFHDCVWEELYNNDLYIYMTLNGDQAFKYRKTKSSGLTELFNIKSPTWRLFRWLLTSRRHGVLERGSDYLSTAVELINKRSDSKIITVSNYSKYSIMYNIGFSEEKIKVLYSPERVYEGERDLSNSNVCLDDLLKEGRKYYLVVSANRPAKNARKVVRVFEKYCEHNADALIVTVGMGVKMFANHIDLPFLSDSDLEKAYSNCYALIYPSYFEGFGYPPMEAMKFGKPVLCSNVCSMPEILGGAPIYFSPFYESAIYGALTLLNDNSYEMYSVRSLERYKIVGERQKHDLGELVDLLVEDAE